MSPQQNKIELLKKEKIISTMSAENKRFLTKLEILKSIDSTNTYLLNQAKKGALSGTVCFSEEQTQGRGRRGRSWFSPPNTNLYCSLLWKFATSDNFSGLSIAVAVMIVNALKKYGIEAGIQLKWPNDILFDNRKLAGILLEGSGKSVVIGIGLNLNLPPEADTAWVSIHEMTHQPLARNHLAGLLVNELIAGLRLYQNEGLSGFHKKWAEHDNLCNRSIVIHTPEKAVSGVMRGINECGELLLEDSHGLLQAFCYGEVSVR